jgi:hypothetical protein
MSQCRLRVGANFRQEAGGKERSKILSTFAHALGQSTNTASALCVSVSKNSTREPDRRLTGVDCCSAGLQLANGRQDTYPALQFDRFDFSDESLVVVDLERTDHVECGVTEAADVRYIRSLTSLNRLVRLQIDVDQLRRRTRGQRLVAQKNCSTKGS